VLKFLQKNKLLPQNNKTNLCDKCHGETKMYIKKGLVTGEIREISTMDKKLNSGTGTEPKKLVPEPEPFKILEPEPEPKYEKNVESVTIQNL